MAPPKRSSVVIGLTVLLALALVPGIGITALGYPALASVTTLAALGALVPTLFAPRGIAVTVVVATATLSALAVPAATSPWWALAVLGATGVLVGAAAVRNASGMVTVAAIGIVFLVAEPPELATTPLHPLALVALATGGAAIWGLAAGTLIRWRRPTRAPEPDHASTARTGAYAVTLATVLGISGWFVVSLDLGHGGGWFLMTFLIILQPYLQDAWRLTIERAIGTVAGIVVAMILYAVLQDVPVALYVAAGVGIVAALTLRYTTTRPYWQYVAILTPAIVLLEGLGRSVIDTAESRLGFTLLAAGIAVGIEAVARPLYRRRATRTGATRY